MWIFPSTVIVPGSCRCLTKILKMLDCSGRLLAVVLGTISTKEKRYLKNSTPSGVYRVYLLIAENEIPE